jgi:HAD superfamily hydrolase (TIGR01549 family)
MVHIEAVIFDLGNTLLFFDGQWPQVFAQADQDVAVHLMDHGLKLDAEEFQRDFRKRLNAYYLQRDSEFIELTTNYVLASTLVDYGYPEVPDEVLRDALEKLYRVSQAHWHAEDDAQETLEYLKSSGFKMGIISNAGDDADVQTLVNQSGLRPYFDFVLSSAACGIRKPNPRIFEIALEHWDLPANRAVMVGDKLGADILGAQNAGMAGIWLTRRADIPSNRDHGDTIHPDATIASLSDLPGIIDKLYR